MTINPSESCTQNDETQLSGAEEIDPDILTIQGIADALERDGADYLHLNGPIAMRLLENAKDGDTQALDQLASKIVPFIEKIVMKGKKEEDFAGTIGFDERIAAALQCVPGVIERFDPASDATFTTFLYTRALGAVKDAERSFLVSQGTTRSAHRILQEIDDPDEYQQKLHELAQEGRAVQVISMDEVLDVGDGEDTAKGSTVSYVHTIGELDEGIVAIDNDDGTTERVENILDVLTEKERAVIDLYFGIGSETGEEISLRKIGEQLGFTESNASLIKKRALGKLEAAHRELTE